MNPLTLVWRKVTYRNEYTAPTPTDGLQITNGRWGSRVVHDPHLAPTLLARRMRLVQEGLDQADLEADVAGYQARIAVLEATVRELAGRCELHEVVWR